MTILGKCQRSWHLPTTSFEGRAALPLVGPLQVWDRILQLLINSPIDSIPQRCSTLLAVRENHIPLLKTTFKETTIFFFFFSFCTFFLICTIVGVFLLLYPNALQYAFVAAKHVHFFSHVVYHVC